MLRLIGNTPLVKLNRLVDASCAEIYVKYEAVNPTGSMKDRMALAMIEGAERRGELKPGGKVAILTFHSGEDRIVKKTFKEMKNSGVYEDVCRNVIRPTKEECHRNSRAKSTKMRWAIKAK